MNMDSSKNGPWHRVLLQKVVVLCGREALAVHDTSSLLVPKFQRSEVLGLVAGIGTMFAAVVDLLALFKWRSSKRMIPMLAASLAFLNLFGSATAS
jgi:MtN3 and saliva related transmembrane protein